MAPIVAPAAMKPNSRLPCSELKMSTTIAQKIETTNRLNTDVQMKKKRPIHTVCLGRREMQRRAERQDGHGKEPVGQRNELPARQHLHQRRKRHVQHQHDDQRAGEQPWQIVHAARDAHLVADRPQDVVGREHRADVEPAPAERRQLGRRHVDEPAQKPRERTAGSAAGVFATGIASLRQAEAPAQFLGGELLAVERSALGELLRARQRHRDRHRSPHRARAAMRPRPRACRRRPSGSPSARRRDAPPWRSG